MPFQDRSEAGRQLAAALSRYRTQNCVVLALPRGGVPVAAEVAAALNAPLDLLLVRKIGAPAQPELAIGAVVDGASPLVVRNEDVIQLTGTSEAEFADICRREEMEIERRRKHYLAGRAPADLTDRVAIIIDDGLATGATMRAALRAARLRKPKAVVLAVPVGPTDTVAAMREEADDVVCLETHDYFGAIGVYYRDFHQVSDHEVTQALQRFSESKGK